MGLGRRGRTGPNRAFRSTFQAHLQALADYNIEVYGLKNDQADPFDTGGVAAVGRSGHVAGRH